MEEYISIEIFKKYIKADIKAIWNEFRFMNF